MKQWLLENGTWVTTVLGFLYAAWEFYNQWILTNTWDWKKFVPALIIWAIAWFIKVPKPKDS